MRNLVIGWGASSRRPPPGAAGAVRANWRRRCLRAAALACLAPLAACGAVQHGFLNAAGPVAGGERHLFVIVAIVLAFVAAPIFILTPIFAWHYRLSNTKDAFRPKWDFSWPLEGFIWIPPVLIVIGLAFLLWIDSHKFDPYRQLKGAEPPVRVQAVALDWKWLFIYPDERIATVGELDVPAGRPVHLEMTSGTVMQSLLLPRLAGQIYAMAGMSTQLNFEASKPGVYKGENTQYNGSGFQDDSFKVVAQTPADYARWLKATQTGAAPLDGQALASILQRSTEPKPLVFSAPPPGLYAHIVAETGGRSQPRPQAMQ